MVPPISRTKLVPVAPLPRPPMMPVALADAVERSRSKMIWRAPLNDKLPEVAAVPLENYNGDVKFSPQRAFRPTDIDDLCRVLKHFTTTPIKAGGARNSYTPGVTNSVYIYPEGMQFIALGADCLRRGLDEKHLATIGGGTVIKDVNTQLWNAGVALPFLGGYDGQTLAGLIATGSHGSVLKYGATPSLVRSMDMVLPGGKKVRIEKLNGITEPAAFAREHPGMALIQDDATFDNMLVTMGTAGVVYSYVLDIADKFYLDEVRTQTTTDDIVAKISGGNIYNLMQVAQKPSGTPADDPTKHFANQPPGPQFHMEFAFNPVSNLAIVTTRNPVPAAKVPKGLAQMQSANLVRAIKLGDKYTRPIFATWFMEVFYRLVGFIIDVVGGVIPPLMPLLTDASLKGICDDEYVQRSYNVFNIGHGLNKMPVQSCEFSVALRGDLAVKAIQVFRDTAKDFAEMSGQSPPGPISIRFVKGSASPLLPSEDYATFEVEYGGHFHYAKEMNMLYKRRLQAALGEQNVFMHWGQMNEALRPDDVRAAYPNYASWRRFRDQRDPRRQFLNPWQKAMLPEP